MQKQPLRRFGRRGCFCNAAERLPPAFVFFVFFLGRGRRLLLCPAAGRCGGAVNTAAIILPVQLIFAAVGNALGITAFFLEIAGQERNTLLAAHPPADLVEPLRVFVRADGQRGAEIIISARRSRPGRSAQAQLIAAAAALTRLGVVLVAAGDRGKLFRLVGALQQGDRCLQRQLRQQTAQLLQPERILPAGGNIGVIKIGRGIKCLAQVRKAIAAAGGAARLDQQARAFFFGGKGQQQGVQLLVIVFAPSTAPLRVDSRAERRECPSSRASSASRSPSAGGGSTTTCS